MTTIDNTTGLDKQATHNFFIIRLNYVDLLTLTGAFLSCLAVVQILAGHLALSLGILNLAVIADAFDGILARKFGLERDFGRYLDGFVDTLMYLFAPALFLYSWGFDSTLQSLMLVAFICSGIIRLSVFNEKGNTVSAEGLGYLGAPVFWSTLTLPLFYLAAQWINPESIHFVLMILLPLFTVAMLHNGNYYKFKNPVTILVGLLFLSGIMFGLHFYGPVELQLGAAIELQLASAGMAIFPIWLGGIIHMVVVKRNRLSFLAVPIHGRVFGSSKTWRGLLVMPAACIAGFYLLIFLVEPTPGRFFTIDFYSYGAWFYGLVLGFSYTLAELPNSALKRALGVPPGELPERGRLFFLLLDQFDSVLGCCLAYGFIFGAPFVTLVTVIGLGVIIALFTKVILYKTGVKATAR